MPAFRYVIYIEDSVDLAVIIFPADVVDRALKQCGQKGIKSVIVISAGFRHDDATDVMDRMGVLAVEMEAAGLYGVAAETGARALTLLTVADLVRSGEALSREDREHSFDNMIEVALEALHGDAAFAAA